MTEENCKKCFAFEYCPDKGTETECKPEDQQPTKPQSEADLYELLSIQKDLLDTHKINKLLLNARIKQLELKNTNLYSVLQDFINFYNAVKGTPVNKEQLYDLCRIAVRAEKTLEGNK